MGKKQSILILTCLVLLAAAVGVPTALYVNSTAARKLPVYCVDTKEKKISISFDAAWGNEDTHRLLEILAKHNVHATFFMTGGWVEDYPEDVKAIAEAGHDLGNHSETHPHMSQLSKEGILSEIQSVHTKVKELTGKDMMLFRAPYGEYNDTVIEAANSIGYHVIQWDVDSLDWKNLGMQNILDTVLSHKHLGSGSIILCHNGADYTADALDALLTGLEDAGYTLVPISELIYTENYEMDHEGRQHLCDETTETAAASAPSAASDASSSSAPSATPES